MVFITKLLEKLMPNALLIIFMLSTAVLGTAYVFQYGFGYAPCELCYYQRYPYMVVIALSGMGVMAQNKYFRLDRSTISLLLLLCAVLLVADAGIAAYHTGVEYKWWEGPTACTPTINFGGSAADRLAQLMQAPIIRCDVAPWSLAGISMAGYNFLIAATMSWFTIVSWLDFRRK